MRSCVNLLDFSSGAWGVEQDIAFSREFTFIEPEDGGGVCCSGLLPPPAHFAESLSEAELF